MIEFEEVCFFSKISSTIKINLAKRWHWSWTCQHLKNSPSFKKFYKQNIRKFISQLFDMSTTLPALIIGVKFN